jgi:hypothetical protein
MRYRARVFQENGIMVRKGMNCLAATALALLLAGCVVYPARGGYYVGGVVTVGPPAIREEAVGVAPYPGYVWAPGYWNWAGGRYVWVSGRWVAPRPGYHWVPHHWVQTPGGWRLERGHWAR